MDDAGEPKTEVCINPDIHHCCKSRARKRTRYLPKEIVFEFLLRLPAQVLHDVMRHVCREWSLVISSPNFIHHHLRNSTCGILIQDLYLPRGGIFAEMRRGSLEICQFDSGFRYIVWTSCNGLVLAPDFGDFHILHVINPLTNKRAILPPYPHQIRSHKYFCLAFVETLMEYKVVNAFDNRTHIAVLTIGVDKVWRHIDIQHLSLATQAALVSSPLVAGAYVHWIGTTFVLTLNVETETIHLFPLPRLRKGYGKFLPMGSNLSVVYERSKFLRDVWEMNPKTGEWNKLLRFDLRPLSYMFPDLFRKSLIPFGWLQVGEVLLLSTRGSQRCCIAYNIKTTEMQSFEFLDTMEISYHFQPHVNSLIQLERGF